MSTLTVRLPDQLVGEVEKTSKGQKISRAGYVRKALESMNKEAHEESRTSAHQGAGAGTAACSSGRGGSPDRIRTSG